MPVALVGATIIDLSDYGNRSNDIKNTLVVFQNGRISYAGKYRRKKIPDHAEVIDAKNKFLSRR